jgi:hypothetical protein
MSQPKFIWKVTDVIGGKTRWQELVALCPYGVIVPIIDKLIQTTLNDLWPQPVKEITLKQ